MHVLGRNCDIILINESNTGEIIIIHYKIIHPQLIEIGQGAPFGQGFR